MIKYTYFWVANTFYSMIKQIHWMHNVIKREKKKLQMKEKKKCMLHQIHVAIILSRLVNEEGLSLI